MKKTFKIGEYVIGGIIEVIADKTSITINFRNMYSGNRELVATRQFQIANTDTIRNIQFYIEDNGTHYYADKIVKFIESKIDLPKINGPFGW
jgi:hypothetical protein